MYQVQKKYSGSYWEPSANGCNNSQYESLEEAVSKAKLWGLDVDKKNPILYRVVKLQTGHVITVLAYKIQMRTMGLGAKWIDSIDGTGSFEKQAAIDKARRLHLKSFVKLSYRVVNETTGKTVYRVQRLKH